ncbi:MAG: aspartate-semialdehyde dehydrogenase [Candidatus Omnitrophica bacterium]|nr:aspartate-semialdehyde dehydrogenase [Candidatus Omnitrophota bacterium]
MKKYNVAVVGVGAVGIEMLRVLKQRNFPVGELRVFARSARQIDVDGEKYTVEAISPDGFKGMDIALFAGTEGEKGAAVTYAEEAVKRGAVVVDNGADFRLDPKVPLVIPEVNPEDVNPVRNWLLAQKHRPEGRGLASFRQSHKGIIANPNCSTIQMVVALWPIYKKVGIKRVVVTTLQAASGAGRGAVQQLWNETEEIISRRQKNQPSVCCDSSSERALPQQIAFNVFPHLGSFMEEDYTSEEWKLVRESHKIMHDDKINISATTVRVPVRTGHSESIYIETGKPIEPEEAKEILSGSPGIIVIDDPKNKLYPMPFDLEGKDEVFVGRIRRDPFVKCGLWLWVVADNLRKGAATNAIQIAEVLIKKS